MKTIACMCLALCLSLHVRNLQAAMPIGEALKNREIQVDARSKNAHASIEVRVRNLTSEPMTLDVFGALMEPRTTVSQRLGVPRLALAKSSTEWILAPKQVITKELPCFCLDHSRSSPETGTVYVLSQQKVDPGTKAIFRYWNEHPGLEQGVVQSAVWNQSLNELKGLPATAKAEPADPQHRNLVVWNSADYWLSGTGDLNTRRADNPRAGARALASDVKGLLLTSKGLVAAFPGERDQQIMRLYDGTRWQDLCRLPFLPTISTTLPSGEILFASGRNLARSNGTRYRLPFEVKALTAGTVNRQQVCLVQDSLGGVHHLDPNSGATSAAFARYADVSVSQNLFAYRNGQDVTWKAERITQQTVQSSVPLTQMLVSGQIILLIGQDKTCWRVNGDAVRATGKLPEDAVSWSLDPSYETLHVLKSNGRIQMLPLTGNPNP